MSVLFKEAPLLAWQLPTIVFALRVRPGACAAEAKRTRVTRIMQRVQSDRVGQFLPGNLARTSLAPFGELQAVPTKGLHRRPRRSHTLKHSKKNAQTLL